MSSFINAIRVNPDPLIQANMQEISYLQDTEKLLYYTDGRIRREYDTPWRSIRPYTGLNILKGLFYTETFDDQIDKLQEFTAYTWEHVSQSEYRLLSAISLQNIMHKAIDQLERLKNRYTVEEKVHNVTVVRESIEKIQRCIRHLTRVNKDWNQFLSDSVPEIIKSIPNKRDQVKALWVKMKLYGSVEDIQISPQDNLRYVCLFLTNSITIPDGVQGEVLCELLIKVYNPAENEFLEKLKRVTRAIGALHQLASKGSLLDKDRIIELERKFILENHIFPLSPSQ